MMTASPLPAVIKELDVACSVARAFVVFTAELDRWWPLLSHSCFADAQAKVIFEPREGGLVEEVSPSGERAPWGTLLEWNPPHRFVMTWHPGQSEALATRLAVDFIPIGDGRCRVTLVHDGWERRGEDAAARREGYDSGWNHVLGLFNSAAV